MKVERAKVVESAISFLKTPWVHGARLKHVGIDCTGLLICAFNEAGADIEDFNDYSLFDEFPKLVRLLNSFCNKVDKEPEAGDILLFRGVDMFNHVALFIGEGRFIHAYSVPSVMSVVKEPYNAYWKQRLKGVYVYKEFVS